MKHNWNASLLLMLCRKTHMVASKQKSPHPNVGQFINFNGIKFLIDLDFTSLPMDPWSLTTLSSMTQLTTGDREHFDNHELISINCYSRCSASNYLGKAASSARVKVDTDEPPRLVLTNHRPLLNYWPMSGPQWSPHGPGQCGWLKVGS